MDLKKIFDLEQAKFAADMEQSREDYAHASGAYPIDGEFDSTKRYAYASMLDDLAPELIAIAKEDHKKVYKPTERMVPHKDIVDIFNYIKNQFSADVDVWKSLSKVVDHIHNTYLVLPDNNTENKVLNTKPKLCEWADEDEDGGLIGCCTNVATCRSCVPFFNCFTCDIHKCRCYNH